MKNHKREEAVSVPKPTLFDATSARIKRATELAPELSVIIPTFCERESIVPLVARVEAALDGVAWEIVFVDDNSPDGTAAFAKEIGAKDERIRCIRRVGRRGLAGACIEGMLASQALYVGVMDADLQHDERLLLDMLKGASSKQIINHQ